MRMARAVPRRRRRLRARARRPRPRTITEKVAISRTTRRVAASRARMVTMTMTSSWCKSQRDRAGEAWICPGAIRVSSTRIGLRTSHASLGSIYGSCSFPLIADMNSISFVCAPSSSCTCFCSPLASNTSPSVQLSLFSSHTADLPLSHHFSHTLEPITTLHLNFCVSHGQQQGCHHLDCTSDRAASCNGPVHEEQAGRESNQIIAGFLGHVLY